MVNIDISKDIRNFINMFGKNSNILPINCKGQIIVSGMGGSGIGGYIASNIFDNDEKRQIIPWNNYSLPSWVNHNDYVICISYSGNTAETLSAAKRAVQIGCKLDVITTGGKLLEIAKKNNSVINLVEKGHQPRAALPLLIEPLLYKIGRKNLKNELQEIKKIKANITLVNKIAKKIHNKIPCIYAHGLMKPVAYRWRCQIEENAKQLAFHHEIPEMNHNEIVGWTNVEEDMVVILIRDNKEEHYIRDRFDATKKLAWLSQDIEVIEIFAEGNYPLTRIISSIYLGDLISLELAKLNNINPTPVEIIEKLKGELGGK